MESRSRQIIEEMIVDSGNRQVWLETIKSPIVDDLGDVIGTVGISRDISKRKQAVDAVRSARDELEQRIEQRTAELSAANEKLRKEVQERKKVEDAYRESEERRALATSAARVGVWDWNMQTGEFYLDPNVKAILGFSDDEIPNDLEIWATYVHPEDTQYTMDAFQEHLDGKTPEYLCEHRMTHKDGTVRWIQARGIAVRDADGKVVRVVGTDVDITDRKEAEEAKKKLEVQFQQAQKMEAVGTLAGGIAHDFNNLLQAVLGYADLLLLGKREGESGYRELRAIVKAAYRGSELTQQLLTFSRKLESELRPLDLNFEIGKARQLLTRLIPKMIEIEVQLAADLKTINADPTQMEQLLMNLAINAGDAMPAGGTLKLVTEDVVLDEKFCRIHPGAEPGEHVLLTISDTGRGMDADTLDHIFEPFFTTKGLAEGTGLGLAMAYGIVKNHGGHIECTSEPGAGTTFKIWFPATDRVLEQEEPAQVDPPEGGTETILLVDDEDFILDLGRKALETFGYTVITAHDGEEGLEVYRRERERIDLVILDLIMPGMGGMQCLEKLLRIDPEARVIVASGFSEAGPMAETMRAGARSFIGKPYQMGRILKIVRDVLDSN
jgi:PAS domain S-box-containing protein